MELAEVVSGSFAPGRAGALSPGGEVSPAGDGLGMVWDTSKRWGDEWGFGMELNGFGMDLNG